MQVSVIVEAPGGTSSLGKVGISSRVVKILGVDWPRASYFCTACPWSLHLAAPTPTERTNVSASPSRKRRSLARHLMDPSTLRRLLSNTPGVKLTARERAYSWMVTNLPCSFIQNPKTDKMRPKAAKMCDDLTLLFEAAAVVANPPAT